MAETSHAASAVASGSDSSLEVDFLVPYTNENDIKHAENQAGHFETDQCEGLTSVFPRHSQSSEVVDTVTSEATGTSNMNHDRKGKGRWHSSHASIDNGDYSSDFITQDESGPFALTQGSTSLPDESQLSEASSNSTAEFSNSNLDRKGKRRRDGSAGTFDEEGLERGSQRLRTEAVEQEPSHSHSHPPITLLDTSAPTSSAFSRSVLGIERISHTSSIDYDMELPPPSSLDKGKAKATPTPSLAPQQLPTAVARASASPSPKGAFGNAIVIHSPPSQELSPTPALRKLPKTPKSLHRSATPLKLTTKSAAPKPPLASNLLSNYTCPICFSPPTNATLTPCGHVCCGPCLFTAVKSTYRRGNMMNPNPGDGEINEPRCPVCRAAIPGWDGKGAGVIGLKARVVFTL